VRPCVVIPIFNEAATIGRIAAGAGRHAPVLVVDDGSTDAGAAIARAAGADVLRHPRRLGKGQALRTGFAAARQRGASHVVTLDGDGQHAVDDVPRLLAAAREAPESLVIGERIAGAGVTADAARLNAIRVAGFFVNWASGLRVADTQSGFRVYPMAVLDQLGVRHGGFVFETEVLVAAAAHGVGVVEVPIEDVPRAARRSRFRPVMDGVAIGAYLGGPVLRRWVTEAGAGAREVAALFDRARLRERHAAMLQAGAALADSPPAWGVAVSAIAFGRARARVRGWWDHPRRRRAVVAAAATLVAPVLLALASARALGGRLVPDVVSPLVRRFYDQALLEPGPSLAAVVKPQSAGGGEATVVAAGEIP
jgi:Glycosyl transferase family 2